MGRGKCLGSLKTFLSWISALLGHFPLHFLASGIFSLPELPWAHLREYLQFGSCQPTGVFPLPESPGGLETLEDCVILVYWYGRRYSTPQDLVAPVKRNLRNLNECSQKNRNNSVVHSLLITGLCSVKQKTNYRNQYGLSDSEFLWVR